MAWTSAFILQFDNPTLIGAQQLESTIASEWSAAGSFAGADITATGFPTYRAWDRRMTLPTKPNVAALTSYLLFDLGATPGDVDMVMIGGHNLGSIAAASTTVDVTVEIADDSAFTVNHVTVATFAAVANEKNPRLVSYVLTHSGTARRYSGARYWRLKFSESGGGAAAFVPKIAEVWLGRRRVLGDKQLIPYDDEQLRTKTVDFEAAAGAVVRYTWYRGQAEREMRFLLATNGDNDNVDAWWDECNRGGPTLFCQAPNTVPVATLLLLPPSTLKKEVVATTSSDKIRRWEPKFVEQDTFYELET